jgi:hypothetical protein
LVRAANVEASAVVDVKVAAADYPYGVTTEAEWARVQPALRDQDPDGLLTALDPGVTDETVDERDLEDRAANRDR